MSAISRPRRRLLAFILTALFLISPLALPAMHTAAAPEPAHAGAPKPTSTPRPTLTPRPTDTPAPTDAPSPTPADTPQPPPTRTPRPTRIPRQTETPTPTDTPPPTPTDTPSPTPTDTPLPTPTDTPSPTPTDAPSPTPTDTPSPTPTDTPPPTPTDTATPDLAPDLLFLGNSLSSYGNPPGLVARLAEAAGRPRPVYLADLSGGADLDYHIGQVVDYPENNVTHTSLPIGDTWDCLIIQGESVEATARLGDPADFRDDALALYRAVRDHASGRGAGVKAVLYETFARAPGNTSYYPGFWANPAAMQADVRAGYEAALDHMNAQAGAGSTSLARAGDAFEAGEFSLDLYYTDLIHQDELGPAVIAMALYEAIYSADVADIAYADAAAAGFTSYYLFNRTYTLSEADWNRCVAWVNGTP